MSDYLKVVYNDDAKPRTTYPEKLVAYLIKEYGIKENAVFLEPGCGRGEHLELFKAHNLQVYGVDLSPEAPKLAPNLDIKVADIENDGLPYKDNTFDVVYSKSVLEHFHYPERYVKEAYRVLKPGGLFLTLTPDWEAQIKTFFDDYTHRTAFTKISLEDIYKIFGFQSVKVIKMRQLPSSWKFPILNLCYAMLAPFVHARAKIKILRWSRELMLVGSGRKPA
jgi:SAM-dependent methyltransferase